MRASGLGSNQNFVDHERLGNERSYRPLGQQPNGGPVDMESWPPMQTQQVIFFIIIHADINNLPFYLAYMSLIISKE